MKFKMSEKSLFALLLRSPWWLSFVLVVLVAMFAGAFLPEEYVGVGMLGGAPFFVIGCTVFWRQRNLPSEAQIDTVLQRLSSMNWYEFSVVLEAAFASQGFIVTRLNGAADMQLKKMSKVTVVSAKRWKAAAVGVEPLRELVAQRDALEASKSAYISLGQFSDKARLYAAENGVTLIAGGDLVTLTAKVVKNH